jgi:hypothetical protein
MSTRVIRSLHDFSRHRMDIEIQCGCGRKAVLPYLPVMQRFAEKRWPIALGLARRRFRCTECGSVPRSIGPVGR